MNFKSFLILCLLLLLIKCEDPADGDGNNNNSTHQNDDGDDDDDDDDYGDLEDLCQKAKATSGSSCSEAFNETIKKEFSCCYTEIKEKGKEEEKECHTLTKVQVNNLDEFKKGLKEENEYEKLEIDCASAFLKIGLFSLFAALLI